MLTQIMAALPSVRCNFVLPFTITGLDFAFPDKNFNVKVFHLNNRLRGCFCLFHEKPVHLEICTNLTTEDFLSTFARFVARRGFLSKIISDKGKTIIGA